MKDRDPVAEHFGDTLMPIRVRWAIAVLAFVVLFFGVFGCRLARAGWGPMGCAPVWSVPIVLAQTPVKAPTPSTRSAADPAPVARPPITRARSTCDDPFCDCGCSVTGECGCAAKQARADASSQSADRPPVALGSNYGLDLKRIPQRETNSVNGRPVSRDQMFEAIAGDEKVPGDAGKLRVTVIGSDTDRKRALDVIDRSPVREQLCVQDYAAGEWPTVNGHRAGIYMQRPGGNTLGPVLSYSPEMRSPEALNKALEVAVRRNDPTYDPAKDPDLQAPSAPVGPAPNTPGPAPNLDADPWMAHGIGAALVACAVAFWRKT